MKVMIVTAEFATSHETTGSRDRNLTSLTAGTFALLSVLENRDRADKQQAVRHTRFWSLHEAAQEAFTRCCAGAEGRILDLGGMAVKCTMYASSASLAILLRRSF